MPCHPCRRFDKARDMTKFKSMSDIDGKIQVDYEQDFYHGVPLQIVGKRLEVEKMLEMMKDCGRGSKEPS
jgi:hypothetical protein